VDPLPKFSGKERDTESQLDYFGARYYDRNIYRFISVDPIIARQIIWYDTQAWNLCLICFDNPISFFDQTGEYGARTHHLVTVYSGIMLGMPLRLSLIIAEANVAVDKDRSTSSSNPFHIFSGAMMKWHFPTETRYYQAIRIARTTLDPITFGRSLHVIQDSFSHEGYTPWFGYIAWGHGGDYILSKMGLAEDCDDPNTDWEKTEEMIMVTEMLMRSFWKRYLNAMIATLTMVSAILTLSGVGSQ
jgi:RHS repeat-associated protein